MKSIFDAPTKEELLQRIENLNSTTAPKWGKMNPGQMLWHCQAPLKIAIENKNRGKGKWLMRLLLNKKMYNDSPFRKNLPTPKHLKAVEEKDFNLEKSKILQMIENTHKLKNRTNWEPHPFFGEYTTEQWGKLEYKHLDHHLNQFGV